jgi:hypothetical protein
MRFRARLSPWLAWLLLGLMFELPSAFLPEPLRITGELLVLLAVWLFGLRLGPRYRHPLNWLLGLCSAFLVLARLDRIVFLLFMGEEPLLYDQLFMLRHLFVLFGDLWSWTLAAGLAGTTLLVALAIWIVRRLLHTARNAFEAERRSATSALCLGLLLSAWLGSHWQLGRARAVRFMTPALLENIEKSHRIYASVQRQVGSSPYRGYRGLELSRKPDVYLIMVESYGRVLTDQPALRKQYRRQLKRMQRRLGEAGWHAVSAFSRAPVMGGRSWLAEGSLLMGTKVGYEAVFHHLVGQIEHVPNLVGFLAGQGYHTVLLAPSDRKRRGVEEVNYYRYQRSVRFSDLGYRGPHLGWGIVPDQYSLGHTDEHVLRHTQRPLFFNFHMVSSHAPWEDVPALVADWRSLNALPGEPLEELGAGAAWMRLQRYVHDKRRFPYAGALSESMRQHYEATILYDLAVIERYLTHLDGDALVIVMGDHQPPFIARETQRFDTPVHVFARDPTLLEELKAHGFADGLWLGPAAPTAVQHEGLFSLFVRMLVRCCSAEKSLPSYFPDGVKLDS